MKGLHDFKTTTNWQKILKRENMRYCFIILIFLLVNVSCGVEEDVPEIIPEQITYRDSAIEGETNQNGELEILTRVSGQDVTYSIKVQNEEGQAVENMTIVYNQNNGKSVFFIKDKYERYASVFLFGTPRELQDAFSSTPNGRIAGEQEEQVIGLFVGLVFTVGAIAYQEIKIALKSYEINKFYLTDIVEEGEDYILYCKDFTKIADLISARTDISLSSASILISFVSAGSSNLVEIVGDIGMGGVTELRDILVSKAIDSWGVEMEDIVNKPVAVKVYFPDQEEKFAKVKTLFAYYEIELDNPACEDYIVGVPDDVNEFLDEEFIGILEDKGLVVHKGYSPPDVTGNYYVDSWTNYETGYTYKNYSYQFTNQTDDLEIEIKLAADNSTAKGYGSYISGENNSFSIYTKIDHTIDEGNHEVYITTANIYSGILTSQGIKGFQDGFIILKKENDLNDNFMEVGDSRLIYESDDIAEKVDNFPNGRFGLKNKSIYKDLLKKSN